MMDGRGGGPNLVRKLRVERERKAYHGGCGEGGEGE